jgi:bifunctional DNase/RNase
MVEMMVGGVYLNTQSYPRLLLRQKEGDTCLQIVIGPFEAIAISMAHNHQKPLRPLSYDLACALLGEVEARVLKVEITDLHEGTFYAEVHLESQDGRVVSLDSRPSDAIALALRTGAPIFAAPAVLAEAGRPWSIEELPRALQLPAPEPAAALLQPLPPAGSLSQVDVLKKRLNQAIAEEAYEEAARLRDQIAGLEEQAAT